MITSPIMVIFILFALLTGLAVAAIHSAQLCTDRLEGLAPTASTPEALQRQRSRAELTAAVAFGLAFLLAMVLVGTTEFPGV